MGKRGSLVEPLTVREQFGPALLGLFVLGSLLLFPVTVLIVATAMALGPWTGFLCALGGCLWGASATFGVGRLLGQQNLRRVVGRTNSITGVPYRDDPTIFAWEMQNEMSGTPEAAAARRFRTMAAAMTPAMPVLWNQR